MKRLLSLLLLFAITSAEATDFRIEEVTSGLDIPWGIAFLNEDELLITERSGQARLLSLKRQQLTLLQGVPPVHAEGQGGLLDVAVPPDYATRGWIYFTYSKTVAGEGATTLARARLQGSRLVEWEDLLVTRSRTDTAYHFGSRIAFDDKGHLFFTIGDRGERDNAQDLDNHAGAVLRLYMDGSVPSDNPYVENKRGLAEIWSHGHRNPQGIAIDLQQRLWVIEHGPRGGDELNRIEPGRNYGWPVISYGMEYWGPVMAAEGTHREGMEQPVKYYVPSIAPGSLIAYSGKVFPQWRGNLFAGALKLRHLNRIVIDAQGEAILEERLLKSLDERIRAVAESPQGWIYLTTDSGRVLRLVPD